MNNNRTNNSDYNEEDSIDIEVDDTDILPIKSHENSVVGSPGENMPEDQLLNSDHSRILINDELPLSLFVDLINKIINYLKSVKSDLPIGSTSNTSTTTTVQLNSQIKVKNQYVKSTQTFLSELITLYNKINNSSSVVDKNKCKRFRSVSSVLNNTSSIQSTSPKNNNVASDLIQINATKEEIEKRIKSFITMKAFETAESNSIEFRDDSSNSENQSIRTTAIPPMKMKYSVTTNQTGPLLNDNTNNNNSISVFSDRVNLIENHLGIMNNNNNSSVPKDLYQRVKAIEDKILQIEKQNPQFFKDSYNSRNSTPPITKLSNQTITHQK
ncbi:hypothetical protein DLAC_08068 [Tieghemostelium lacteum]|uniref:Uncharacterized protein n=1 Tax=Tieghemostelium lacteum TaxID=361077 RepID=A0A151ZB48_TIELA|nr:hypothetical protein DLAC_08068 [Tieghemostelium lacteum]|eukprot:KYQ91155.1 hypothetical protein DLAC_08068 [Tieghemostelium lacteum]